MSARRSVRALVVLLVIGLMAAACGGPQSIASANNNPSGVAPARTRRPHRVDSTEVPTALIPVLSAEAQAVPTEAPQALPTATVAAAQAAQAPVPTTAAGQALLQPAIASTQAPVQPTVVAQGSGPSGKAQQGDTIEQGLNQLARDMDKVDTLPGAAN